MFRLKKKPGMPGLVALTFRLSVVMMPGWFGYIRYGTPIVHPDDHRDLARQAFDFLIREGLLSRESELARNRKLVEASCGLLDAVEMEDVSKGKALPGWDYSHMYDPLEDRGVATGKHTHALDEFRDFWDRARVHLSIGSSEKAYVFLGYCCHLLQDMAVPSHTYCIAHGLKTRMADNLELISRSRRFYLRLPDDPPHEGDEEMHVALFKAMGVESRGREPDDTDEENEIAGVLERYYRAPALKRRRWKGAYIGEPYYPYHRLLPSSPRIKLLDLVTLRNFLMERAASRTAQLLAHFEEVGSGHACASPNWISTGENAHARPDPGRAGGA